MIIYLNFYTRDPTPGTGDPHELKNYFRKLHHFREGTFLGGIYKLMVIDLYYVVIFLERQ